MFLIRGLVFTHEAVRDWEAKLAPLLAEGLRQRRAGNGAGTSTRPRYCRRIQAAGARAAKRVTRVLARCRPSSQLTIRDTFIAAAMQTC